MISVVIPVYNQYNSLCKVLDAFYLQIYNDDAYEIIVVDDGSSDDVKNVSDLTCSRKLNARIIHQENKGRAAARNTGINDAKGDIIIFCDADRFPRNDFIMQHTEFHKKGANIVIGASFDYFGKNDLSIDEETNWKMISRFSRLPPYFKKISLIYDESGQTSSKLSWLSFLVGNMSIKRDIVKKIGGFDESFIEWGFEHFDLGYRLYIQGYQFSMNINAINYHIPHLRHKNFYRDAIELNSKKLITKYKEIDERILAEFVNGRAGVEITEKNIFKEQDNEKR